MERLVKFIASDLVGRVTSLLIGIVIASVVYQNFIMVEKETQLDSKDQLILVKEERVKSINDQLNVLKSQLSYKPYKDKQEFDDLKFKSEELQKENTSLSTLINELQVINNNPVSDNLAQDIAKLKSENSHLTKELEKYIADVIVSEQKVDLNKSWSGFGGLVVFGVDKLSAIGYGNARLSVNGVTTNREIRPGDQFQFDIGSDKYLLSILSVEYVLSRVTISVSKKI